VRGARNIFSPVLKVPFHNEELHNLYCSRSIIRMIDSRRIRWEGQVTRMGRRGMYIDFGGKAERKEATRKTET
jgi:hypothetical protein